MTTLVDEAARKVLEAWQTSCYGKYAHQIAMVLAMADLSTALAQQELPQKERPDFMAGYDAGMADAKRTAQQAQPAQASGRTNPGDETGGAVERFGWQTFLGKSPEIIPATNGSFVWYSDYLKLWQSAQSEDGCAPNHMCNGHRVHIPTGECCNKCGATSW